MNSPIPQMPMSGSNTDPMPERPQPPVRWQQYAILAGVALLVWGVSRVTFDVIPDPALRQAIQSELGRPDSGANVTRTALARLESLAVNDSTLRSLSGLQFATQLRAVQLRADRTGECLERLEAARFHPATLNKIPHLESLDLSLNGLQLGEGDWLRRCQELRALDLSGNAIETLDPLTELPRLEVLRLSSCRIEDWSALSDIPALRELYLDDFYADIPYTELAQCSQLRVLKICGGSGGPESGELDNQAGLLSIAKMTNLESLKLSYLNVSDVTPLHAMPHLYDFSVTQDASFAGMDAAWMETLRERRAIARTHRDHDGAAYYSSEVKDCWAPLFAH